MERIVRFFGVTRENRLGFTLVELMIVIAIIGILAGISVPMYLGQRKKAMMSEAETNLMMLYTLEEQFYAENGRYAPWPDRSVPTGTANYTYDGTFTGTGAHIEDVFPQFKPGPKTDLKFDYWLQSLDGGKKWHVAAVGKSGTPMAGQIIWLNYLNAWERAN